MNQANAGPSATQGFMGKEVFGDHLLAFDKFVNLLGHVPIISDLVRWVLKALGFEAPTMTVAGLTFIFLMALIIIMWPALKNAYFNITRSKSMGSGANARFATWFEVYRRYTIPSKFSTCLFSASVTFIFMMLFYYCTRSSTVLFFTIPAVYLGCVLGGIITGPYEGIRKRAQPYPLGKYRGFIPLYLTGGARASFIRGDADNERQNHVLVVGPPGARKTTAYFIPGLLEDAHNNCSAIVIEAKNEAQESMYDLIAPTWAAQGKRVILFDPFGNGPSVGFNPLLNLKPDYDDTHTREVIDRTIDAIIKTYEREKGTPSGEAYFHQDQEISLLRGLMYLSLYKPEGQRNLSAIHEVVNGTVESVVNYAREAVKMAKESDDLAKRIWKDLAWFIDEENISKRDRSLMLRGTAGKLQVFANPRVKVKVVSNELDLDSVFKTPTLLCIKAATNDPGASTIASMIIRLLMMKVPEKLSYGAGDKFKLWFYLDELPALAIPKFEEFLRTARSSGTGVIAAVQDLSDLADVFKPKLGMSSIHGLAGNFKTQVLLPGLQPETAKYYADSFGKTEVPGRRTFRNSKHPTEVHWQSDQVEKPLITPDKIKNMREDEAFIVDRTTRPFKISTEPFYQSKRYKVMITTNKNQAIELYKLSTDKVTFESPPAPEFKDKEAAKKKGNQPEDIGSELSKNRDKDREGGFNPGSTQQHSNGKDIAGRSIRSETDSLGLS